MKRIPGIVCVLLTFISLGSAREWQWQNPLPQGNSFTSVDFVDNLYGWAVTAQTIWHTTDGGTDWTQIDLEPALYSFGKVAFVDRQNGWVCDYSHAMCLHTTDGGGSWNSQFLGTPITIRDLYDFCAVDAQHCFASGRYLNNDGTESYYCLRTNNGGEYWISASMGLRAMYISFTDRLHGWGADQVGDQIQRTTDGGLTWSVDYTDSNEHYSIHFADTLHGWCGGALNGNSRIVCTTDGGTTWTPSYVATSTGYVWHLASAGTQRIWATSTNQAFRSSDGGVNWQLVASAPSVTSPVISVSGAAHACIAGQYGVMAHTTDNGATWTRWDRTIATGTWRASTAAPGSRVWVVGDGGQIAATTDGGNTWALQASGTTQQLVCVCDAAPNRVWAGGSSGTLIASTDGGAHWTVQSSLNPTNVFVAFGDSLHGWIPGPPGMVGHTTDGGATWQTQMIGQSLRGLCCVNADSAWALSYRYVFRTTNGGLDWFQTTFPASTQLYSIYFVDNLFGWCAGGGAYYYRTTDGGVTWQAGPTMPPWTVQKLNFTDRLNGWAAFNGTGVPLHTTDGGNEWITDYSCYHSIYSFTHSGNDVWAVGFGGVIQKYAEAQAPLAVSDVVAQPLGGNNLQLNWTAPEGFTGTYTVYVNTVPEAYPAIGWIPIASNIAPVPGPSATSWIHENGTAGSPRLFYTVIAVSPESVERHYAVTLPPEVRARLAER